MKISIEHIEALRQRITEIVKESVPAACILVASHIGIRQQYSFTVYIFSPSDGGKSNQAVTIPNWLKTMPLLAYTTIRCEVLQ